MKGGRGKEEWKWVKSGGEAEWLSTVDWSTGSRPVDERIIGKTKGGKKREKERGK